MKVKNIQKRAIPLDSGIQEAEDLITRKHQLEMDLSEINERLAIRLGLTSGKQMAVTGNEMLKMTDNEKPARGPRVGGRRPLGEVLLNIVTGSTQPLTVDELANLSLENGYHSKSKNHSKVVRELLYKDKRFKKIKLDKRHVGFVSAGR